MERVCEIARTIVPFIRRCFCGDEENSREEMGSGDARFHTVIRELSPVTRDIRSVGLGLQAFVVPETRDDVESGDGAVSRPGSVNGRGPVLIDNFLEERLTTGSSVEQEDDLVYSILGSPNLSWYRQQYSTANEVDADSPAIIELTAAEESNSRVDGESETTQQESVTEEHIDIADDPENETGFRSVKEFYKVTSYFCIAPHDITTASKIRSKWGIVQKAAFLVVVGLALLKPMSYLKATYMDINSSKTDFVYYASFAIQLVTVCTYIATHTISLGEVRDFLDSLTDEISCAYTILPVSAMLLALFGALFGRLISNLSAWNLEEEHNLQAHYTKEFFLQWQTGNDTQDISDKWTSLDNLFGVTGFLSKYAAYYLDYFVQHMFLVIAVMFSGYSKRFILDMKKVFESNENRDDAVKELVRNYEKLQEKKAGFNNAFGGLFDCFHFRNLFRCVYFVYAIVEKVDFRELTFYFISTTQTWIVYYLASKTTRLNGKFRHLISKNLEAFTQAVGDTKVNFLLNDILVNPVGLGDGVSFVDGRFISELISMIATYVVILVTNKD